MFVLRLQDLRTPSATFLLVSDVGAPGRIRTCGLGIRSPLLYPLSYGRVAWRCAKRVPPDPRLIDVTVRQTYAGQGSHGPAGADIGFPVR